MDNTSNARSVAARLSSLDLCGRGAAVAISPDGLTAIIVPMTCKSWLCDHCRPRKIGLWRLRIVAAKPQRFITLTALIRPEEQLEDCVQRISRAWTTIAQAIRRKFGPMEYCKLWELTAQGNPHLHILQKGPFVPQKWLSAHWDKLTACPIVDIRAVRQGKHAARYIVKYMSKTVAVFATKCPSVRVISCSRKFLADVIPGETDLSLQGYTWHFDAEEPWQILSAYADMGYLLVDYDPHNHAAVLQRPPSALPLMQSRSSPHKLTQRSLGLSGGPL